ATTAEESPYFVMGQLGRVLVQIENNYVDPVERTRLVEGAIGGMVSELDPHSSYMPPQDWKLFQSETEGKFAGVGGEVDVRGEALTVIAPIEGSPAYRAGIKSGDQILAIDGESTAGAREGGNFEKIVKKMRGAPGTHIKLTIKRAGGNDPFVVDLVRE